MNDTAPAVEASYWQASSDGRVTCELCPQQCSVAEGTRGVCNLRENRGGVLYAAAYGEVASVAVDPIEKKPLYHFHPGEDVLSTGPNGCNFRCRGCQNFQLSQEEVPTHYLSPEALAQLTVAHRSPGLAYTYTEPLVWFEYVRDACLAARERGLYNVAVSNGFLEPAPARELASLLDAANVDLKSMSDDFYRDYCGGRRDPVLRTCETFKRDMHLEITNLLVTGLTDGEEDVAALVKWIAENLGPDTPLHFSRYFPHYHEEAPATPVHHLLRAKEIADRDLYYVYLGNVHGVGGTDTLCPQCGNLLVERSGYRTAVVGLAEGKCNNCDRASEIVL
ncbi:MAG: AmmeMemoRadiSam system radical SAM enzyme [Candidatus Coatesbacteria bacterium]|nr:MAG: AmmeMemoRadiSam system radical SAM enzyme [Candidatus Coatesbacteria bacterium]